MLGTELSVTYFVTKQKYSNVLTLGYKILLKIKSMYWKTFTNQI